MAEGATFVPPSLLEHVRWQAHACAELGSPFYAVLLDRVAGDLAAGGPSAEVFQPYGGDARRDVPALRLMGGVHWLVLTQRAPELAAYFPSVGGSGDAEGAWPALRSVLGEHREELRTALRQAPQTNEVGRAAVLIGGLLHVVANTRLPVQLVEIGASAGLNLWADRFRVEVGDGRGVGPADSPVVLANAWRGELPPRDVAVAVVGRSGCDLVPADPTTPEGRLTLTSYVWPDQSERLERLRGALAVVAEERPVVERARAADFLDRLQLRSGATTVLWHSVMWQYLPEPERHRVEERVAELSDGAAPDAPFARLSMEPVGLGTARTEFPVSLQVWPGGVERRLGVAAPHGVPVTWDKAG